MKRRFNYSGRQKILEKQIGIKLLKESGVTKSFDVKIDLNEMKLPEKAKIYLEAYHKTDLRRFPLGSVGNIEIPSFRDLSYLSHVENLHFRFKIVDEEQMHGLILAEADQIRPLDEHGDKPKCRAILPVEFVPGMGNQIWRIYFGDGQPILEFNREIPDIHRLAKSDPAFFFHVYPAVVREILKHIFFVEHETNLEEPDTDWHKDWIDFSYHLNPMNSSLERSFREDGGSEHSGNEIINWINGVVEEFCGKQQKGWLKYLEIIEGGSK